MEQRRLATQRRVRRRRNLAGSAAALSIVAVGVAAVSANDGDVDVSTWGDVAQPLAAQTSAAVSTVIQAAPDSEAATTTTSMPTTLALPQGVLNIGPENEPSARGVMVDGWLLTSADALGADVADGDVITVSGPDGNAESFLMGRDPFTDVAVLELRTPEPDWGGAQQETAEATPGEAITLVPSGRTGSILESSGPSMRSDGHPLLSTLRTSIMADMPPGEVAVDSEGRVIGIAITAEGYLVEIVPWADATESARHLVQRGWPAAHRLGADINVEGDQLIVRSVDDIGQAIGLLPGDIITAVADTTVSDISAIVAALRSQPDDEPVTLSVQRDSENVELNVPPLEHTTEPVEATEENP